MATTRRKVWARALLATLVSLTVLPTAADSVEVVQRFLTTIYLEPMGLQRAVLKVETAPYFAECPPDSITIRVYASGDPNAPELFRLDSLVYDDKLDYLFAQGPFLESYKSDGPAVGVERTLSYLAKANGWAKIADSERPAYKPGFMEWWMRDPDPQPVHGSDVRRIHFWATSGLPRMIGFPTRVSGNHCGPPDDRFPVLPRPEDMP